MRGVGPKALRWIERAATLLVAGFLTWYVIDHWQQIARYPWQIDVPRLALASACATVSYSGFVLTWRRALQDFGGSLSVLDAHRVWYLGNLGRYVPGKVLQLAGTAYLARAKGVRPAVTIAASLVAQLFVLGGGVIVAGVALPELATLGWPAIAPVGLGFAIAFVFIALTPLFGALHRLALRLTRQSELHADIGIGERLVILAASTASKALLGLAFALFVIATTDAPASALVPLIGICAAGYLAGYLVVFVPGGLGVREGVYAVLLALYIPASVAVAVAILARLWLTLVELVVVAFLVARYGTADLRAPAEPSRV